MVDADDSTRFVIAASFLRQSTSVRSDL